MMKGEEEELPLCPPTSYAKDFSFHHFIHVTARQADIFSIQIRKLKVKKLCYYPGHTYGFDLRKIRLVKNLQRFLTHVKRSTNASCFVNDAAFFKNLYLFYLYGRQWETGFSQGRNYPHEVHGKLLSCKSAFNLCCHCRRYGWGCNSEKASLED